MTEQDILNKIKESADSIEIPESLKPEQIELKLQAEKKIVKFRWQAKHLIAAAVAMVIMLAFIPLGLNNRTGTTEGQAYGNDSAGQKVAGTGEKEQNAKPSEDEKIKKQDAGELYLVAKSYDEVYEFLQRNEEINRGYYKGGVADLEKEAVEKEAAEAAPAEDMVLDKMSSGSGAIKEEYSVNESAAHETGYSTTNLQMAGVDESDIVKTNGSHIFMVKDGIVQIVKITDGKMTLVGTISPELESFSDSVLEMYVDGDRLLLITQQTNENLEETNTGKVTGGYLPLAEDEAEAIAEVCVDVAYNLDISYKTVLYTYDISNPAKAKQIGKVEQDGRYQTSRKIDDMVYLFTQEYIALETGIAEGAGDDIAKALPKVNGEEIAYDSIYLPEYGYQGLLVSSVTLDNPNEIVDNTLILNDSVKIYVSSSALYLYHLEYVTDTPCTQIAKFSLENGIISAVAAASVPGTVQDTFAINEYKENLRILTSYWNGWIEENTNQLYILDELLKPAGKIENIAEGETIYAARYFGDLAYFITYRNIDPLFAADLSDIQNPQILGELKITGYSEYLHMWGEDKLLGIGYETNEKNGSREGIKLVMFDISNPSELAILDTIVLKDADYSPALYNYKCVLADSDTNMIGFVTVDYSEDDFDYNVYSFVNGKFQKELVNHEEEARYQETYRGLWAGEYFYIVNQQGIESFHYTEGYEKTETFKFVPVQ